MTTSKINMSDFKISDIRIGGKRYYAVERNDQVSFYTTNIAAARYWIRSESNDPTLVKPFQEPPKINKEAIAAQIDSASTDSASTDSTISNSASGESAPTDAEIPPSSEGSESSSPAGTPDGQEPAKKTRIS